MTIVVSGFGAIAAVGAGREALATAFAEGRIVQHELDRSAGYHRAGSASRAATVHGIDLGAWLSPRLARRMSPPSKLAVAASRMALEDAGLAELPDREGTAVVLSTAFGPSSYTEEILLQIHDPGPSSVSPFLFTESVANAAAAQVALVCGAAGPNLTVTQREAGPLLALGRAHDLLASGQARRAIVLAVDELNPLLHAILDRFGGLTRELANGLHPARPFDRDRRGTFAAEGATALILETSEDAEARHARVLARPRATVRLFDPRAPVASWSDDGERVGRDLRGRLEALGVPLDSIDLVVSGASGVPALDRFEADVLRSLWPDAGSRPPVLAPKAWTGDHGGGPLAGALLALEGRSFSATPGFREADPALGIVPYPGGAPGPRRALVAGLSAGGSCAWGVLDAGSGVPEA